MVERIDARLKTAIFAKVGGLREQINKEPGNIHLIKIPNLDSQETRFILDNLVTDMGPAVVTFPNVPHKPMYNALRVIKNFDESELPPYIYSCPEDDERLLQHEPDGIHREWGRYFDRSRKGPEMAARRSLDYARMTANKMRKTEDLRVLKWVDEYGIGIMFPFATLREIVQQFVDYDVDFFTVPGTSVAESYREILKRLGINSPENKQDSPWLNMNGTSPRSARSNKLFEAFQYWIGEQKNKEIVLKNNKKIGAFIDLYNGFDAGDIAELLMMMINDPEFGFLKSRETNPKEKLLETLFTIAARGLAANFENPKKLFSFLRQSKPLWAEILKVIKIPLSDKSQVRLSAETLMADILEPHFNPHSHLSHYAYGGQDDASELVVRGESERLEDVPLIPWSMLVLTGDGQTTTEQLVKQAQLYSQEGAYRGVSAFILTDKDGNAFDFNKASPEEQAKAHAVMAMLLEIRYRKLYEQEKKRYFSHFPLSN